MYMRACVKVAALTRACDRQRRTLSLRERGECRHEDINAHNKVRLRQGSAGSMPNYD